MDYCVKYHTRDFLVAMSDFKVIKCQSCGSSVVDIEGDSIIECSHCGSKIYVNKAKGSRLVALNSLLLIGLIVFVAVASFWYSKDNSSVAIKQVVNQQQNLISKPISAIPKLDTEKLKIHKAHLKKEQQTSEKQPEVSVTSSVQGQTSIGGWFWIFTISNDSDVAVARPGVTMSLFDSEGNRIDELRVWARREHLPAGQHTEVLLFLAKPPEEEFTSKIVGMAKTVTKYDIQQEEIKVKAFIVKGTGKKVEIVGDVYNPNNYQVDFIEIVAIAKNSKGTAVGTAKSYASITNLPAQGTSGFKISAGTFVAQEPETWELWAVGRKHRSN